MYPRNISPRLRDALADSPVVLLSGARQTGKTTLAQQFVSSAIGPLSGVDDTLPEGPDSTRTYLTLDDSTVLASAKVDPIGFIADITGPVVIDEVQHAPEIFPAIKLSVDRNREPGRFLLTGSANVLLLPKPSESLAGRMELLTLWPLAQAEIEGQTRSIVDLLFNGGLPTTGLPPVGRDELIRRLLLGGYPEPLGRKSSSRRRAWFKSYITTLLQRDVRDIANIERLSSLPRLLALLASRTASLLNLSDLSSAVELPYATLHRYMAILEATFLIQPIPAWSNNIGIRFVKAPKLVLNDTGLAASLLGLDAGRLADGGTLIGPLTENMVAMDLKKDAGWSETQPDLFHYRTHSRHEVDLVLESADGRVVGIEVKAAAGVSSADFNGLRSLAQIAGDLFVRGVILYTDAHVVPFGEKLHTVPLSLLWM